MPPALGRPRDFSARSTPILVLEAPPLSRNLEIKPYVIADVTTTISPPRDVERSGGDIAVDAKYSITQNLTADLTYNTDFGRSGRRHR